MPPLPGVQAWRIHPVSGLGEGLVVTEDDFSARLEAARLGDEHAFTAVFRSVQPSLLRYLRTIGGSLADDVAAETWVSVVRGVDRFRGDEDGFRAWVFTIARARLADARRTLARTPLPMDAESVLAERADPVDVVERVEEIFSTESALGLIGRLPRDQAEVVLLRHVAGLDVSHTAEVLGKRSGAVRVACHRGLRRLGDLLEASYDDPRGPGVTQSGRSAVVEMRNNERAWNGPGDNS